MHVTVNRAVGHSPHDLFFRTFSPNQDAAKTSNFVQNFVKKIRIIVTDGASDAAISAELRG